MNELSNGDYLTRAFWDTTSLPWFLFYPYGSWV